MMKKENIHHDVISQLKGVKATCADAGAFFRRGCL